MAIQKWNTLNTGNRKYEFMGNVNIIVKRYIENYVCKFQEIIFINIYKSINIWIKKINEFLT